MPMKNVCRVLVAISMLLANACMSLAPRSRETGTTASELDGMPARRWADNSCAAGALSEVLSYHGTGVTEAVLGEALTKGRRGGVVSVDLLIAARNYGYDARLVRGDAVTVHGELENKRPVILMLRVLDTRGNEDDLFHYVVLTGFDSERQLVCMHYGDGKKRWVDLRRIDADWKAAGNATFLFGPRAKRIASEQDLRRAVVLEEAGKLSEAVVLYRYFVDSHPTSALGWTNLGNAHARQGDRQLAEVAYRNAVFLQKADRDALNNLAVLLLEERRLEEAESLARRAVDQEGTDQYLALDTLARIFSAQGRCLEAVKTFEHALSKLTADVPEVRADIESGMIVAQRNCGSTSTPEARKSDDSGQHEEFPGWL